MKLTTAKVLFVEMQDMQMYFFYMFMNKKKTLKIRKNIYENTINWKKNIQKLCLQVGQTQLILYGLNNLRKLSK